VKGKVRSSCGNYSIRERQSASRLFLPSFTTTSAPRRHSLDLAVEQFFSCKTTRNLRKLSVASKSAESVSNVFEVIFRTDVMPQKESNFHPTTEETSDVTALHMAKTSELFKCNLERR